MLSDLDLQTFITQHAIPARLVYPGVPTPTVPEAARALGVDSRQILKSLVFLCDETPHLIIAAGESRIDYKKVAAATNLSRRKVRIAAPEEALSISGFVVGAMPPFGHKEVLKTLIDVNSVNHTCDIYYGGGGSKSALLEINLKTLFEVCKARVEPLT